MPPTLQKAPGKVILFGEHAVVFGQPAIAVPLLDRQASVSIQPLISTPATVHFSAPDIDFEADLQSMQETHPFAIIADQIKQRKQLSHFPGMRITIRSTIPVASGLGSGAAVSVALAKAILSYLGFSYTTEEISDIAFHAEKAHHGTPSGIDNTVIAYQKGIIFQREKPVQWLNVGSPMHLLIVNSKIKKSTRSMVDSVREQVENKPDIFLPFIEQIGKVVLQAKPLLESGHVQELGSLMTENHGLLRQLGVSTQTLDEMVQLALDSGAFGAKLSGAGGGGNMIALVDKQLALQLETAFHSAGYPETIHTIIR